jgi:membrane-associated protease RseP (regulator of RpoE activity)
VNQGQDIPALNIPSTLDVQVQPQQKPSYRIHIILFVATVFTTLLAGALMEGAHPIRDPASIAKGIPFSFTLMAILLTHEMGHYLTAKNYGVPATLPYFIPAPPIPFLIGTFGAFIRMKSPILTRKAILEIGASGPIAGFVVAIIAVIIGLNQSQVVSETASPAALKLGAPLIFDFLNRLLLDVPDGSDVLLHPVAFAGWIGLFVTALNLIPIGQLDGGHVVYALLGRRHTMVSIGMVGVLLVMGFIGWPGWYFWAFLTAILGVRHPPMVDPEVALEPKQKIIGWLSLAIFVLCFTPNPFIIE